MVHTHKLFVYKETTPPIYHTMDLFIPIQDLN